MAQKILKYYSYIYNNKRDRNAEIALHSGENVIKGYRLHFETEEEENEPIVSEMEEESALLSPEMDAGDVTEEVVAKAEETEEKPKKNRTFWEEDEGNRENISDEAYAAFLANAGITLNSVDDIISGLINN